MKLLWTGTDSLMLVDYSMRKFRKKIYWWLFRRMIWIMDRLFIQEHYCDSKWVAVHVEAFGVKKPITIFPDRLKYTNPLPKIQHAGFNILYYFPENNTDQEFNKWLYGFDIYERLHDALYKFDVTILVVDGNQDMKEVFPIMDFYLRPNRHDGASRLRQECEIQEIPYYWSRTNPDFHKAFVAIRKEIENVKEAKSQV